MDNILVTGATGFIGSQLVRDLAMRKHKVVALARKASNVEHLSRLGIEIRSGDLTNLRSLIEACKEMDIVINLAAITSLEGMDYERSFLVNVVGSQNVIDACKINQVKRIIFMATQSDNPGAYATTKREAEKIFRDSGLNVTIIKPSLVYGQEGRGCLGVGKIYKEAPYHSYNRLREISDETNICGRCNTSYNQLPGKG